MLYTAKGGDRDVNIWEPAWEIFSGVRKEMESSLQVSGSVLASIWVVKQAMSRRNNGSVPYSSGCLRQMVDFPSWCLQNLAFGAILVLLLLISKRIMALADSHRKSFRMPPF